MSGLERLEQELEEVEELLEAFDNPPTSEAPSLRLLENALRERRDAIAGKLESGRRNRMEVTLETSTGVPEAGLVGQVLALVDETVRDAASAHAADPAPPEGRELSVRVHGLETSEQAVTIELSDAALPERLTVRSDDGRPLAAVAFEAAVEELGDGASDPGRRLRELLGAAGAALTLVPPDGDPVEVATSSA